jgi:hypothetical protein
MNKNIIISLLNDDIETFCVSDEIDELVIFMKNTNYFFKVTYPTLFQHDVLISDILAYFGAINCLKLHLKDTPVSYSTVVCSALSQNMELFTWCFMNTRLYFDQMINLNNIGIVIKKVYSILNLNDVDKVINIVNKYKDSIELDIK